MKVQFTLKKETLDIARALIARQTPSDAIVQAEYHVDAESQAEAFDKAAVLFASDWLTVEY